MSKSNDEIRINAYSDNEYEGEDSESDISGLDSMGQS